MVVICLVRWIQPLVDDRRPFLHKTDPIKTGGVHRIYLEKKGLEHSSGVIAPKIASLVHRGPQQMAHVPHFWEDSAQNCSFGWDANGFIDDLIVCRIVIELSSPAELENVLQICGANKSTQQQCHEIEMLYRESDDGIKLHDVGWLLNFVER